MEAIRSNGLIQMVDDSRCTLDLKSPERSKAKSFEGCRSSVRMTMHEVVHEMVVGESHEPNYEGSGSAWKAYMNARVAGLFMLVLLEYPNGSSSAWKAYMNAKVAGLFLLVLLEYPNCKGVVSVTSKGLDMAPYWSRVRATPLMSLRKDEISEPLLYAGWMAGPYR
ncbi:hypothetical protein Tco_0400462, partial [Tanacetum coccineum]